MKGLLSRARWGAFVLVAVLSFATGGWLLRAKPAATGSVYQQARLFENVLAAIHQHYIDSLGEGQLYRQAANALVGSLDDPYAELLIGEEYRNHQLQMAGNELGAVDLTDERTVTRRVSATMVHVSAASRGVLLSRGIGYVALHRVSERAADELRLEIDRLRREGMRALVLDLRLNPGGLIREGVRIAGLFLQHGDTVATSDGRGEEPSKIYLAEESGGWGTLPLVVLVNRGTASSAELIAGALQDHDRAVVIGTPTYGKGVLQTTYPLGREVALKLTTARWFTPSGRNIQRPPADSGSPRPEQGPAWRPEIYRTAGGRPVSASSGIVPDLLIRSAPRAERERALLAALGGDLDLLRAELGALAQTLAAEVGPENGDVVLTPAIREELYARLQAQGLEIPRETYDAAGAYIEEQLGYEVARLLNGPGGEARDRVLTDRQLRAALGVLRRAATPEAALRVAQAEQERFPIR